MLRYKTKTRPGLVALYDIRPGNGAGPFLQPQSLHGVKLGWRKPNIHPNPTNLALFRRKIALYRFNQGGAHTIAGGSNGSRGTEPPHFNHWLRPQTPVIGSLSHTRYTAG